MDIESNQLFGSIRACCCLIYGLTDLLTYTEFEDDLDYGSALTLSIVEDSGRGIYLLMPKILLTELRQHFSIEND